MALEGIQSGFRDTILALCLLHHSATKLGLDPGFFFKQAAAYGTDKACDFMDQYLKKGEKNIRAMAMDESYGPDGFDYTVIAV